MKKRSQYVLLISITILISQFINVICFPDINNLLNISVYKCLAKSLFTRVFVGETMKRFFANSLHFYGL